MTPAVHASDPAPAARRAIHQVAALALLALLLPALLLLPAAALAKKADLTFDFPAKKTLRYQVELQREVRFMGMDATINQKGIAELQRVGETPEGNLRIAVAFSEMEGSEMRGDDLNEREPELNGKKVVAVVSPHGKVLDIEPEEPMSEELENQTKGIVSNFFAYLPNEKRGTGDTWTEDISESHEKNGEATFQVHGEIEYTLEDLGKTDDTPTAKIYGSGKAKIHAASPMGTFEGETEAETELRVAVPGGYTVRAKSSAVTRGSVGSTDVDQVERFECKLLP